MQIGRHDLRLDNIGSWPKGVRMVIISLVCLLLAALGYWFNTSNQLQQLQKLQRKEPQLKQQLAQKQQLAANLPTYQKQLRQAQQSLQQLVALLPTEQQFPKLLEDISKVGQTAGLHFSLLQPMPEQTHPFYVEAPIKIVVAGDYNQLIQFINQLSSMPRIVTVGDFTIVPAAEDTVGSVNPELTFSFTAVTYRYQAKAQPLASTGATS